MLALPIPARVLLVQAVCAVAHAADYPTFDTSHADAPVDLTGYDQVWADEFDTLKASNPGQGTGPWFTGGHAVLIPGEKMAGLPDPAYSIDSGILSMSTRVDPADSKRVEAHLQTDDGKGNTFEFQDGYLEARMWVPPALGSHAGLWLLSKDKEVVGHTEVDVVESYGVGDPSVHSGTHIWPVNRSNHARRSKRVVKKDIFDGFHLYGVLATGDYFAFYYDRKELARIPRLPEQRVPLYLLLSVFGNPTQPVIEPATMKVDYVRLYVQNPVPKPPIMQKPGA